MAFVKKLFGHVVSQDSSGRNATNTFLSGKGDVLLTFESEAINARLAGRDIQYVIPRQTMLIELLVAVMKKSPNKDAANSFIRFMKSEPEQPCSARTASGRSTRRCSSSSRSSTRSGPACSRSTTR